MASNSSTIALLEEEELSILSSGSNTTPCSSFTLAPPFHASQPRLRQASIASFTFPIVKESVGHCFAECWHHGQ